MYILHISLIFCFFHRCFFHAGLVVATLCSALRSPSPSPSWTDTDQARLKKVSESEILGDTKTQSLK